MSAVKTIDWSALRKDFPILDQKVHGKPLVYFDNAATSQKPLKPFNESRALTGIAQNVKT
jgi:selenocysteine lyase/cysteine desulfurase